MFGLPTAAIVKRQLPKKLIYEKFNFNASQKAKFDNDISRIDIIAEISPSTCAIAEGANVKSIYVLQVLLKSEKFEEQNINRIASLIQQNLVFVLCVDDKAKLAIHHNKLIQNQWESVDDISIPLQGLNLDYVYENITTTIGEIVIEEGLSLDEQIASNEERERIKKQIEKLERQAKKEKQPSFAFEIHQEIIKLKKQLGE